MPTIEIVEDTANMHTGATKDVQQPDEELQLFIEESTQVPLVNNNQNRSKHEATCTTKDPKDQRGVSKLSSDLRDKDWPQDPPLSAS